MIIFQSKVFLLTSLSEFALATSWFLVYDSLKSIMRVTTLFINSVFCWSRKMATIFMLASEVSLRSISLFAPDIFIISGLRSSGAYDAFSTFFHRQYCLLVTKDGHNDYLSVESFFTDIFVRVCFSNFLISGLRIFEEYSACYHFIHRQYCLLVTKDGHNDYLSVESFLLTSLSEFALATSWFLF